MVVPYNPVVTVKKDQRFKIVFEGDAVCTVKVGDIVVPETTVFDGQSSEILQSIQLSKELGISPKDVKHHLLKSDGEIVDKGDVIARRSIAMGTIERVVKSQHDGRVSMERLNSGVVDIRAPFNDTLLPAGVHGRVSRIMPDRGGRRELELDVTGYVAPAFRCTGKSISGEIFVLKDGASLYRPADVDGQCRGKVVIAGRSLSVSLYEALTEVGARGIVVGGMPRTEYRLISEPSIPIFITEGWGIIPLNRVLLNTLVEHEGDHIYIDEDRGQLLVCPSDPPADMKNLDVEEYAPVSLVKLEKGATVQVWDMPFWGYSGTIMEVMEDEELVKVQLESGRSVVVPPECLMSIGEF